MTKLHMLSPYNCTHPRSPHFLGTLGERLAEQTGHGALGSVLCLGLTPETICICGCSAPWHLAGHIELLPEQSKGQPSTGFSGHMPDPLHTSFIERNHFKRSKTPYSPHTTAMERKSRLEGGKKWEDSTSALISFFRKSSLPWQP